MALGLIVGWSRVFLGVHFPYDVAAALPVAGTAAVLARSIRSFATPVYANVLRAWVHVAIAIGLESSC